MRLQADYVVELLACDRTRAARFLKTRSDTRRKGLSDQVPLSYRKDTDLSRLGLMPGTAEKPPGMHLVYRFLLGRQVFSRNHHYSIAS